MARTKLTDVLSPTKSIGKIRWQTTVPIVTNPFIMLELIQFALVGASIVLIVLAVGFIQADGMLEPASLRSIFGISGLVFVGIIVAFSICGLLGLGNRYYALYECDSNGIYYEYNRGKDERKGFSLLWMKPYPVIGNVRVSKTKARTLPWEKADRFYNIPSMRTVIIRRRFWTMLRLHMPDEKTHETVVNYLVQRLVEKQ